MRKLCLCALLLLMLAGCACQEAGKEIIESTAVTAASQETIPVETTLAPTMPETTQAAVASTEETPRETGPSLEIVQPEPEDDAFVMVHMYIPDVVVDLRYATEHNFTGQVIYGFDTLWLRYGTVKKLMRVQEILREQGLGLKVWDGFRPPAAQFKLWDVCPDPIYVSNPNKGFSSHSRGNTVDLTLVYTDGTEAVMPTGFDDFSKLADRDYSDCSLEAAENARLLESVMKEYGFKPYSGEWWHFTDTQAYPVEEVFLPVETGMYIANCREYISLREIPSTTGNVITRIPAGERFLVVAQHGDFALVWYGHLWGYVLRDYILPIC